MKYTLIFSLLIIFTFTAIAQSGVYKTYEDYLNDNLTEYAEYSKTYHTAGNYIVVFKNEKGEKIKYHLNDKNEKIWGYRRDSNNVLRVNYGLKKYVPSLIYDIGKVILYLDMTANLNGEVNWISYGNHYIVVSKDLNSEMIQMSKKKWEPIFGERPKARDYNGLIQFILDYNNKHR